MLKWELMTFSGCANLTISATDIPNITANSFKFNACSSITSIPNMNNWDVSNITSMSEMFYGASNFNEPIGNWNVSKVTNMNFMFRGASGFNQPIGNWDVSKVSSMTHMFYEAGSFNQPLDNWDVSNTFVFQDMFRWATSFNQSLGNWNMKNVSDMASPLYYMLANSGMDCNNYSQTIIGWGNNSQIANTTVTFAPSGREYGNQAVAARDILISKGWNFIGDALDVNCQSSSNTAPSAPSNLVATPVNSIELVWQDNSNNEDGFHVESALSASGPWTQIATVGSNVTGYLQSTGLTNGVEYFYRVSAYNTFGTSSFSNVASAVEGATGLVYVESGKLSISIYPNPASAYLTIKINDKEPVNGLVLKLINIHGKLLEQVVLDASKTTIRVHHLPAGIYFYTLSDKNEVLKAGKMVIE